MATQATPKRGLETGGLRTSAQRAEADVLKSAGGGFDVLNAGGFANRDAFRQRTNEAVQQQKRIKRTANAAFRQANRRGDKAGALDILLRARQANINFGGIQAAGRDREEVLQRSGEDLITAMAKGGQQPAQAAPGGDVLDQSGPQAQFDPASGVKDEPTQFGAGQVSQSVAGAEPAAVQAGRPFFEGTPEVPVVANSFDALFNRGSSHSKSEIPVEQTGVAGLSKEQGDKDRKALAKRGFPVVPSFLSNPGKLSKDILDLHRKGLSEEALEELLAGEARFEKMLKDIKKKG